MTSKFTEPVAQLLAYGDPREETECQDYLSLGFTEEHVPELIKMATDENLYWTSSESLEVWAPVHAWRTLGQLKAEQAIEPLMALFDFMVDFDDDWIPSELPTVYAMIGPSAIPALAKYLSDNSAEAMPGISVAESIEEIGKAHPDAKLECAQVLSAQLEQFHHNSAPLNGFLISGLVGLQAVDRLPLIQQAFDKRRVDLSVGGDMEDVEIALGLRKKRSTPRPLLFEEVRQALPSLASDDLDQEPRELKIEEMIRALAVAGENTRNVVSTNE